jgi:hypothetical protein
MKTYKNFRLAGVIGLLAGLGGCIAPPQPAPPGPPVEGPNATDLLHSKVDAYNAGLAAGKRVQARRDQAAIAAAQAVVPPACPSPAAALPFPPTAKPVTPTPVPAKPVPSQAQVYTPGGPAIPVAPAQ